jgi:type III secretion protein D
MTKQFRILTGCHAGARLNLQYGIWTIGSDEQADVQISDWEGETMFLEYRSDGTVTMTPPPGKASSSRIAQTLLDWMPSRHGQTVFCVGPADAEWPSEVSLFEKLLHPVTVEKDATESTKATTHAATTQRPVGGKHAKRQDGVSKKRWAYSGGAGVALVGLVVGLTLVLTDGSSEKARAAIRPTRVTPPPVLTPAEAQDKTIQAALQGLHQTDVTVTRASGRIVLGGIVASAADALAIRRALQELTTAPHSSIANVTIDQGFSVADNIADDLQSTLNDGGLTVHYAGHGVFTVSGVARNLTGTRALLAHAQNDYGGRIRHIDDKMTQASTPSTGAEAMLDADGLRYIQMPDGSKSFAPDPSPVAVATPAATGPDSTTSRATVPSAAMPVSGAAVTATASAAPTSTSTYAEGNVVAIGDAEPARGAGADMAPHPAAFSHVAPIVVKSTSRAPLASALPPGEAPLPSQP